jgi:hypothetical protein
MDTMKATLTALLILVLGTLGACSSGSSASGDDLGGFEVDAAGADTAGEGDAPTADIDKDDADTAAPDALGEVGDDDVAPDVDDPEVCGAEICDGMDNDCDGEIDEGALPGLGMACEVPGLQGACAEGETACVGGAVVCEQVVFDEEEACDGLDNDCDGAVDEGPLPGAGEICEVPGAQGICAEGETACVDGVVTCAQLTFGEVEACNGVDDDCDGLIDPPDAEGCELYYVDVDGDGFATGQVGACLCEVADTHPTQALGDCDDDDDGVSPDGVEVCNAKDDDCDGTTDGAAAHEACQTLCGEGLRVCAGGSLGACDATPPNTCTDWGNCASYETCGACSATPAEVCDGDDDDCDGLIDAEDPDLIFLACELQEGVCAGATKAADRCVAGAWEACVASDYLAHAPSYEDGAEASCDGLDNDCDGAVDDDLTWTDPVSAEEKHKGDACGAGECDGGVVTCDVDGGALICSTDLATGFEVCDGIDNDCDGFTDADDADDLLASDEQLCEHQAGLCVGAVKPAVLCVAGAWQACDDATYLAHDADYVVSGDEACDGVDVDCDGVADEDYAVSDTSCGEGACVATGQLICQDGAPLDTCEAGSSTDQDSTCDGVDDDCDGLIDEDYVATETTCGAGGCAATGLLTCADGALTDTCEAGAGGDEVCNGIDDDCDGLVDAADPLDLLAADEVACEDQDGVCAGATKPAALCVDGAWTACEDATYLTWAATYEAGDEASCDQADNDCDGETDEGDLCGPPPVTYAIVDTAQAACYDAQSCDACPVAGAGFFGQDSQYVGNAPAYQDHGDGTVTDLVTGLMWQQDPGAKKTRDEALTELQTFSLAGHDDWRLPSIKELYSLILFSGTDVSGCEDESSCPSLVPFIDEAFAFEYGDTDAGERLIDSQYLSSTLYVSTTMNGDETAFGVNFADGRIKGYGLVAPGGGGAKTFFVLYVRAGESYGENDLEDMGDGTVTDWATGLAWTQEDSGGFGAGAAGGLSWKEALAWCEGLSHAGHDDWRLPDAKELQSILDYTRSPDTSASAALDPVFAITGITNEGGEPDWPFFWSGTTHAGLTGGKAGAYVAFGRGLGFMQQQGSEDYTLLDVHGAGCQRSDPKVGDPADYPNGHGPQGDVIRIYNHARCVRGGAATFATGAGIDCPEPPDGPVSCDDAQPGEPCCGDDQCDTDEDEQNCPADCSGGTGTCGDDTCDPGEQQSCPDDCQGGQGPTSCTTQADCEVEGACPPGATMGCTCATTPQGNVCIPKCEQDTDCPSPPDQTLICSQDGTCVPEGGGPPGG